MMLVISKLGDSLPNEYYEFKKVIKNNFENIYDINYIFEELKKMKLIKIIKELKI